MEIYEEIFKKFSVPTLVLDRDYKIVDMSDSALHVFETHDVQLKVSKCHEVSHASNKPCGELEHNSYPAKDTFESGRRVPFKSTGVQRLVWKKLKNIYNSLTYSKN